MLCCGPYNCSTAFHGPLSTSSACADRAWSARNAPTATQGPLLNSTFEHGCNCDRQLAFQPRQPEGSVLWGCLQLDRSPSFTALQRRRRRSPERARVAPPDSRLRWIWGPPRRSTGGRLWWQPW